MLIALMQVPSSAIRVGGAKTGRGRLVGPPGYIARIPTKGVFRRLADEDRIYEVLPHLAG
jgi:hypothetical protein